MTGQIRFYLGCSSALTSLSFSNNSLTDVCYLYTDIYIYIFHFIMLRELPRLFIFIYSIIMFNSRDA